jgi:hypothetical protein
MQPQPNHPHQNKRQQSAIMNCSNTVAKTLSTHVTNDLTQVSVPAEDESQQSATFTHALRPALACPIMPLVDQHFCIHFKSYKLSTYNQNFTKNKRKHQQALIVLQKPQTTK